MKRTGQVIAGAGMTGAGMTPGTIPGMTPGMTPGTVHLGIEAGTVPGIEVGTILGTMVHITPIVSIQYIMAAATRFTVRLAIILHEGHLALVAPASVQAIAVQQVAAPLVPAMVAADPVHRWAECQVAAMAPLVPLVAAAPLAAVAALVAEAPSAEAAEVVAQAAVADLDAIDSL